MEDVVVVLAESGGGAVEGGALAVEGEEGLGMQALADMRVVDTGEKVTRFELRVVREVRRGHQGLGRDAEGLELRGEQVGILAQGPGVEVGVEVVAVLPALERGSVVGVGGERGIVDQAR